MSSPSYTNASGTFFSGSGFGYPYSLGAGNQAISNAIPLDNTVLLTLLRWGNWDAYNGSTQWNTGEVPSGISVCPNAVPTSCVSSGSCAPSFYLTRRPGWWPSSIPFPAIGPDVVDGNVGQCTGTLGTPGQYAEVAATASAQCTGTSLAPAWGGHVNATPAMACYLNILAGLPDGTGSALPFDGTTCYPASAPPADAGAEAGPAADDSGIEGDATNGTNGTPAGNNDGPTGAPARGTSSSGCGCRAVGDRGVSFVWAGPAGLLLLGLRRRRR
jgi:hypothetical protein